MSISDATISTDVFDAIRTAIVAISPKITEGSPAKYRTASVLAQYNDTKVSVPQIVITPTNLSESEYRFGGRYGKRFINVTVECYYTTTLGVDQLADQVKESIVDAIDNKSLIDMDLVGVSEDYAFTDPNQIKYHLKSVTFTFVKE
jgi:hypothetical protein